MRTGKNSSRRAARLRTLSVASRRSCQLVHEGGLDALARAERERKSKPRRSVLFCDTTPRRRSGRNGYA